MNSSVTDDGAATLTGKDTEFASLFPRHISHSHVPFHRTVYHEALCAEYGLNHVEDMTINIKEV